MTFTEAKTRLVRDLTARYGSGEAASIARIVMEDAFQWHDHAPRSMTASEIERYEAIAGRLDDGEPLQYVLGAADFLGLKFLVTPAVLIPRQETELLVVEILKYLKISAIDKPVVLDIGLGSGCIGLTLKRKFPAIQLFGMEKSEAALEVARQNSMNLLGSRGETVELFQGDILEASAFASLPLFDLIVSNPPYIPLAEKHLVPEHVQAHEPALALFVETEDPLLFYRVIAVFAAEKLRPGGALFFECNEFNATEVRDMLREKGFQRIELQKDLFGADRILRAFKRG